MRIAVLGGSSASPNTGAGCSGYLVESNQTRVVLDLGPGTLPELRRHTDHRRLSGIVISHMHLDHVLDLLALRHALAYNPIPAPAPIPIWLPPGGRGLLAQAAAPFDACDRPGRFAETVSVAEYVPDRPLTIGGATITFAPTVHYVPGYAIRLTDASGRSLGYTGDTGPSADLSAFFAGVDLLIAESTLLDDPPDDGQRGSLTAREAGELARRTGAPVLMLTHMWEELGFDAHRARAAKAFPGRIELARPGLQLTI